MKVSLITGNGQPVQELRIAGHIKDGVCQAAFKGTFENKLDTPIETSFTFPLPAGVCSTKFKVEFGGQKVVSRVARNDSARVEYDDTLAQNDFAAMAQVSENNDIRIDIGTLAPKETCKFALYFVIALNPLHNGFLLVLPTSITSFSENLRLGLTPPPLKLQLDVTDSLSKIASITTPFSDNSKIEFKDSKGTITCDSLSIFHPLHVVIKFEENIIGRCLYQNIDNKTFLNIVATAPRSYRNHPSQFTVMFENSPNLTGGQISLIMRALEFFVLSVPQGCKFNFCKFGMNSFQLFDQPTFLNDDTQKQALNCLKQQTDHNADNASFADMQTKILEKVNTSEMESVVMVIASSLPEDTKLTPGHNYFFLEPFSRGDLRKIAQTVGACYVPVADESSVISSFLSVIKMTATAEIENAKLSVSSNGQDNNNDNSTKEFPLPPIIPGYTFSTFLAVDGITSKEGPDVRLKCSNLDIKFQTTESQLPILNSLWAFEKMRTASPEEKAELALANQILTPDTSSIVVVEREEEVEGDVSHVDSRLSHMGIGWIQEPTDKEKEEEKNHNDDDDDRPIIWPHPRPFPRPIPRPFPMPIPVPRPMPMPILYGDHPGDEVHILNDMNYRRFAHQRLPQAAAPAGDAAAPPANNEAAPAQQQPPAAPHNAKATKSSNKDGTDNQEDTKVFIGQMPASISTANKDQVIDLNKSSQNEEPKKPEEKSQAPPPAAKPKKYLFFLLRVLQLQNADGSWTNEKGLVNSIGFPIPEPSNSKGLKREQFMTAFVICCIRRKAPKDEEKWELVVEKGLTFLNNSDPNADWESILKSIDNDLN